MSTADLRFKLISPVDPRWARTNAVSDVRLCAALARQGHDVEWIVPSLGHGKELSAEGVFRLHDVTDSFAIRFVRTPRWDGPRDVARIVPLMVRGVASTLPPSRRRATFAISRDMRLLAPLLAATPPRVCAIPWLHEYRARFFERWACGRAECIFATNSVIVDDVRRDAGDRPAFITGNPVLEAHAQSVRMTRREARAAIGIEGDRPLVVYTGKLVPGMAELDHLLHAAKRLRNCHFVLTGGQPQALEAVNAELARRHIDNVILTGFLPSSTEIRVYQQAASVLVSYYSVRDHKFARQNLPNKLAEYMSTGNPVVVADFPAVRDLATSETAVLVEPDDPEAFVMALLNALDETGQISKMAARAQDVVRERSFERVAAQMYDFLSSRFVNAEN